MKTGRKIFIFSRTGIFRDFLLFCNLPRRTGGFFLPPKLVFFRDFLHFLQFIQTGRGFFFPQNLYFFAISCIFCSLSRLAEGIFFPPNRCFLDYFWSIYRRDSDPVWSIESAPLVNLPTGIFYLFLQVFCISYGWSGLVKGRSSTRTGVFCDFLHLCSWSRLVRGCSSPKPVFLGLFFVQFPVVTIIQVGRRGKQILPF